MTLHDALLAKAFGGGNGGNGGGANIDVVASVGQTIVVEEVDADGKPTRWKAAEFQERTHWSEEGKVQVLLFTKRVSGFNSTYGYYTFSLIFNEYVESLPLTSIYSIEYDGVEYTNLAMVELQGNRFFGNLYYLNSLFGTSFENTGEPFLIAGDSAGMMLITLDSQETLHTLQIYINGTYHHRIDNCYQPQIPIIDLTDYVLSANSETTISGDEYFDKVYSVLKNNDMVKIVYRNGGSMYSVVACPVRTDYGAVYVRASSGEGREEGVEIEARTSYAKAWSN